MASPQETTTYTVTITDLNGCKKTDAVKITVIEPAFWLPTAFTPDDNGISDIFYVRGEGILNFEFSVYNRWGEKIFFTKDIKLKRFENGMWGTIIDQKGMINLIR